MSQVGVVLMQRISRLRTPVAVCCAVLLAAVVMASAQKSPFTVHDKAYYAMQSHDFSFTPGVIVKMKSATIASDGTIQADFTLNDPASGPLDMTGVQTAGSIEVGLVIAVLPKGQEQYVAYTTSTKTAPNGVSAVQAAYDQGGTFNEINPGEYVYTFATKAPAGFDASATHTIGVYAERDLSGPPNNGTFSGIDDVFTFVPNGSAVTQVRDVVREATCNKCHDRMSGHGGSRTKVLMCDLCHNPQTVNPDTGNSMDMKVMIHKIHMGSSLPSVVAGGSYKVPHRGADNDFSKVVDPADARRCETCHDPKSGAAQADAWLTKPTRDSCGSCHDNVKFATGVNHVNLPQFDDNQCTNCHKPQGEQEFDASIKGAHTVPIDSKKLAGVAVDILNVVGKAGSPPTVTFTVKDGSGAPIALKDLQSDPNVMSLVMAGPTSDYGYTNFGPDATTGYVVEDPTTNGVCTSDGTCTYTFTHAIPAKSAGTYAIGIEATRLGVLMAGTTKSQEVEYGAKNKVFYFSVDGSPVQPRRTVALTESCNNCHVHIAAHGQPRNQVEMCILCHNPSLNDAATRAQSTDPKDLSTPAQALNFNLMIHRIHTGENLQALGSSYLVVSHRGRHADFSDVQYPGQGPDGSVGDTRKCGMCHTNGTEQNLPSHLNSVSDPQGPINPDPAVTAACTGCHVTLPTASHAMANTSALGESCEVCHGANGEFNISKVHAE